MSLLIQNLRKSFSRPALWRVCAAGIWLLASCAPANSPSGLYLSTETPAAPAPLPSVAPFPTRPAYQPAELVEYTAQTGDTLPALAARFNTTEKEIREANSVIPNDATTMPPGFPMHIPIYYEPLWGNPFQIIPDSLFPYGPAQRDFDPVAFVNQQPGWLKTVSEYYSGRTRSGGELVDYLALSYSVSPRLLLALIEYQTGALTEAAPRSSDDPYPLGFADPNRKGLPSQINYAANVLNNGYYGWRTGRLTEFDRLDTRLERPDPWQNAATVALQFYFSHMFDGAAYDRAISDQGFIQTYTALFGDPWQNVEPHIPGSLRQPEMRLPFQSRSAWAFTGGPHTGWGTGEPWSAIDFAPPAVVGGCMPTTETATAIAGGILTRTDTGIAVLDLDGDRDERTGWVVFYLHLATASIPPVGTELAAGQPIGLPSCEGGRSTGTHVHIARKYNGEWIPASGPLAFNLEGWIAANGSEPYQGELVRYSRRVRACECSDQESQVQSQAQ